MTSSEIDFWISFLKLLLFVLYILTVSISKQIRNVFAYHGAEHKVVHCYEDNNKIKDITPEKVLKYSRIHKRCGTTFIFLIIFLSILTYALIPINLGFWNSFIIRLLFLPILAGISFEILKLVPKLSMKNPLRWMLLLIELPGLGIQYLTTKEPNKKQIEVAIDALKNVVD